MNLDLSLPEPPERKGGGILAHATFGLALVAVVLLAVNLVWSRERPRAAEGDGGVADRAFAEVLEKRTLWREAAAAWEDLAENGEDLFRAGKCRMLAGEPERAARDLLAAEARGLPEDLAGESSRMVLEAYAMLGKLDVRNQALERRTGGAGEKPDLVARVGGEQVTRAELLTAVRDEEVARLLATGRLDAESLDRAVSARGADPKLLAPTLSRLLSTRALALEALADGLGESPDLARRLREIRNQLLANLLVENRLLDRMQITGADLEDHYRAHAERYTAPEAARFSWGTDPASLTEAPGWHEKGAAFPDGLPRSAEADAMLFALKPGEVSDRAVRIGDRDVYLGLRERRPARAIPFAEARERVAADLSARKRTEAMDALRAEVKAKHPVEIVDPELARAYADAQGGGR